METKNEFNQKTYSVLLALSTVPAPLAGLGMLGATFANSAALGVGLGLPAIATFGYIAYKLILRAEPTEGPPEAETPSIQ